MKSKSELLNKPSRAQNGKMVVTSLAVGLVLFVIGAISIVYMAQARNEIPPAKAQILAHEQQEIQRFVEVLISSMRIERASPSERRLQEREGKDIFGEIGEK